MNYKLTQFKFDQTSTALLNCAISTVIAGDTWIYTRTYTGQAAKELWAQRGLTEDEICALILQ